MAWFSFWSNKTKDNNKPITVQHSQSMYDVAALNAIVDSQSLLNKRNRELIDGGYAFDTSVIDLASVENAAGTFGIVSDKFSKNIINWRLSMAPEVKWCLDEVFSELADTKLQLEHGVGYSALNDDEKSLIDQEFVRFSSLFNFNNLNLQDDIRHLLIEGEIAYEGIRSEEHPEYGIIGIRRLYSDDFSVVYSPILTNGFALNVDLNRIFNRYGMTSNNIFSTGSKFIYDSRTGEFETDMQHAALTFPNVAYIYYDKLPNVNVPISLLDYAHLAYFELYSIQQAAMVMRIVRSPERLLFNVDVGGLSDKAAKAHIREFGNKLRSQKVAIPTGVGKDGNMNVQIGQEYNPSTMLESYIFGKSNANGGTTAQTLQSTANFDQINDINYFQNRLLRVFNIPFARITEPSQKSYQPSQSLTYDEVRFYKFIVSIEERFNNALTNLFLENLRLRKIGGGKISNAQVSLKFETPARYALFLEAAAESAKFELYEKYANREEFNKSVLAKKFLGMLDSDLKEHKDANFEEAKEKKELEKRLNGDSSSSDAFNGESDFNYSGGEPEHFGEEGGESEGFGGEESVGGEESGAEVGGEEPSFGEPLPD